LKPLRILPQVESDLLDIWLYIARDNPPAADRQIDQFTQRFEALRRVPELGAACPEIAEGLRHLPIGRYVLFYSVRDDTVVIERILHGARDIEALFD